MVTKPTVQHRRSLGLNRERAREMRHEPVACEKLFWSLVRDRKLGGFKFRRQVLIGPYIADFVCAERRFVVELDGNLHDADYDARRDAYLASQGYCVFRMRNEDFVGDPSGTMLGIQRALTEG